MPASVSLKRLVYSFNVLTEEKLELFRQLKALVKKKTIKPKKLSRTLGYYRFFFVYFLYFWFNCVPVLLFKPFLKVMYLHRNFKSEIKKITRRYFILFRNRWSFDFIFLLNSAISLYNFNLFTPFFLMHILFTRHRIMRYISNFTEIIDRLFWLKRNILGLRLLVIGPFKSKKRSIFTFQKGVLDYNFYSARLLYETLICPTSYGVSSIKFWIYYKVPADKI